MTNIDSVLVKAAASTREHAHVKSNTDAHNKVSSDTGTFAALIASKGSKSTDLVVAAITPFSTEASPKASKALNTQPAGNVVKTAGMDLSVELGNLELFVTDTLMNNPELLGAQISIDGVIENPKEVIDNIAALFGNVLAAFDISHEEQFTVKLDQSVDGLQIATVNERPEVGATDNVVAMPASAVPITPTIKTEQPNSSVNSNGEIGKAAVHLDPAKSQPQSQSPLMERLRQVVSASHNDMKPALKQHSAKALITEVVATIADAMGVSKPMTNRAPTATGTLLSQSLKLEPVSEGQTAPLFSGRPNSELMLNSAQSRQEIISDLMMRTSQQSQGAKDVFAEIMKGGVTSQSSLSRDDIGTLNSTSSLLETSIAPQAPATRFEAALMASVHIKEGNHFGHLQNEMKHHGFSSLVAGQIKSIEVKPGERTKIELAPKGLGGIEIQFDADLAGKTRAIIRVENPMVLEAMRNDRAALEQMLAKAGIDLSNGIDLGGYQSNGGSGQSGEDRPEKGDGDGANLDEITISESDSSNQIISDDALNITV